MIVLALVTIFLFRDSFPAFVADQAQLDEDVSFMRGKSFLSYAAPLIFGTLLSSLIALAVAVPLSIAVALFISHFAPRRLAQGLGYLVDLLAAIPSVVYGLWGFPWPWAPRATRWCVRRCCPLPAPASSPPPCWGWVAPWVRPWPCS